MKLKKFISGLTSAALAFSLAALAPAPGLGAAAATAADYTYKVTPLLTPINQYFFVKTDNPDPTSFRFVDNSTVYSESSGTLTAVTTQYADVTYDDIPTLRVNGGYIFWGSNTDGGTLTLQNKKSGTYSWNYTWEDTSVTVTLPALKNSTDYLVDTYATKSEFFDNMSAVQSGFSSICLYSGSYVRGEVYRPIDFWSLSNAPHVDQTFYIQSPYRRNGNESLFASAVYPYRYDSLGFPSVMSSVAKKLDSTATVEWSNTNHSAINVTYNGTTRTYGGQGNGEGQGISKDKILKNFTFGSSDTLTLDSSLELLRNYMKIEMDDDIPRDDQLTWASVCDTVGDGAWVKLTGIYGIYGASGKAYTYLYTKNDGSYFYADEFAVGSSVYWGGDLGFGSDTWIDGRYINKYEIFQPGETFDDHPTANILLCDVPFPEIEYSRSYKYNYDTGKYEYTYTVTSVKEIKKNVLYNYSSTAECWQASSVSLGSGKYFSDIQAMKDQGVLDEKYYDMLTLTADEARAAGVDKNTNVYPHSGYIFDGSAEPGTPFFYGPGDVDLNGEVDTADLIMLQKRLAGWGVAADELNSNIDGDDEVTVADLVLLQKYLAGWPVTLK